VAAPTFNPPGGTYTSAQNVTISCATPGVTIYYSTDGSTPSIRYTKPINISSTTTLKAKATKSGWTDSQIASAVYTINQPQTVATPTFSPPGGTYISAQSVRITCATSGATIRYTTNGSEPTTNSPTYSSPINVSSTTTIKAKGFKNGWTPSSTASATYTINAVPPGQMIFVPGGTFTMGDTRGQGYSDELPTHTVTLNSFYIGKYEVTQAEYSQYMPSPNWTSSYGLGDNYPAYRVSWYAILKYCNLRSMAEGLTPCYSISGSTNPADWGEVPTTSNSTWNAVICNWNASGYRLPTEAEWEYAARGATNNPDYLYSGSDDINAVAWYTNNSGSSTHPVGTKAPNGIGTYDMSGNVWEWCWDWYSSSYYSSSPQDNPTGPASGSYRVGRGGSWSSYALNCTVSFRFGFNATDSGTVLGFRICRVFP
jgi:sulfatase modifying factor 1